MTFAQVLLLMPAIVLCDSVDSDRSIAINLRAELVFALLQCYWQSIWDWRMTLL